MYCRPQGSGRGDDFRVWWLGDVDNVPENDWMNIDIRKDHADYMDIHASYMPTVASVEDPADGMEVQCDFNVVKVRMLFMCMQYIADAFTRS